MTSSRPITVLCIDDHALVREGMAALINRQQDMTIVGEGATGREGVSCSRRNGPTSRSSISGFQT